jgi:hypothetical protein
MGVRWRRFRGQKEIPAYSFLGGNMRLVTSLQVFLIAAPMAFAQAGQPIRNSSLIGMTILHRPTGHCSNGTERAFLVDVSKQSPKLVPVLPELTSPLGDSLILDAEKQTLFSNSESHVPDVLHASSEFYKWIDDRRGFIVLRGEFSCGPDQITYSQAVAKDVWPSQCDKINHAIRWNGYAVDLATNRRTSLTEVFRSGDDHRYNEAFAPIRSKTGRQVGWIFKSSPPEYELWAVDISGGNLARVISEVGTHGCAVSPRDPILACENTPSGSITILGVNFIVLAWIIHDFASKKRKGALKD